MPPAESSTTKMTELRTSQISVRGARLHNLKSIDVDIPHNQFVVITGVSGSGKSSLAFDTLFAEGQRKYFATLSLGARKKFPLMPRAEVDSVTGLPPTLSLSQHQGNINPRSTLGTTTEIDDYLRQLYATAGEVHCPKCGSVVSSQSSEQIVESLLNWPERTKLMLLAPVWQHVTGGDLEELFDKIVSEGFVRARVNGELYDLNEVQEVPAASSYSVEVVVDRLIMKADIGTRLQESVETALNKGEGQCIATRLEEDKTWSDHFFNERFACHHCDISYPNIQPATFSFNSPQGACEVCQGLGQIEEECVQDGLQECAACKGTRLNELARHVTFRSHSLTNLQSFSLEQLLAMMRGEEKEGQQASSEVANLAAEKIIPEVVNRLHFLLQVGLGYLTLSRPSQTLSGGEYQRARLASTLGTGITGACFVLDEPTNGLHARDTENLLTTLRMLCDRGNSLIVIEHDIQTMQQADYLIDVGPGAGTAGGEIVAVGTPAEVAAETSSVTGQCLRKNSPKGLSKNNSVADPERVLQVKNATCHNVKNLDVDIPLQKYVCFSGVSGSGKSSLVMDCIVPALKSKILRNASEMPLDSQLQLAGYEKIERVLQVSQKPLGKNALSTPATFSGLWDEIRKVYAQTQEARLRGFKAKRFSYNSPEGRCEACQGRGVQKIEMQHLADIWVDCETCRGRRFNTQTLAVRFLGKTVADLLEMKISDAAELFQNMASLHRILKTFEEVGLGYLTLGQSATTLSGGESQRVKLATELSKQDTPRTLFVLDEPSSGLHPADIEQLLILLKKLVQQGHSVWMIEHQPQMIAAADWLIDMGPEGGEQGGKIVVQGPPATVRECSNSYTGQMLKQQF